MASINLPVLHPVTPGCPVEVFRWGGQPDHHSDDMPHSHPFDEMLLVLKGGGEHRIGKNIFTLEDRTIHFLPAGTAHQLQRAAQCEGGTVIFLREHILTEPYLPFKQLDFLRAPSPVIQLDNESFSGIWLLYEQLLSACKKPSLHYPKPLILSWMNALLVKIAATYPLQTAAQQVYHPIIKDFKELVDRHFKTQKSVGFYARMLCISPQYLHEICLRETGKGPQESIASHVCKAALALLSSGKLEVKQVAFELGFDDPAYFSRFFKKQTGKSPSAWLLGSDAAKN